MPYDEPASRSSRLTVVCGLAGAYLCAALMQVYFHWGILRNRNDLDEIDAAARMFRPEALKWYSGMLFLAGGPDGTGLNAETLPGHCLFLAVLVIGPCWLFAWKPHPVTWLLAASMLTIAFFFPIMMGI